ncbi:sodium-dependent transporter [Methanosarcina sp. KYL-1]|uniref:sodium-dependent transporter n=1 Tax=Methanosarcina sp. KYL-1 TaxID=2602068 RepID=UPI0021018382|nr:sodium-dependent transporter [Methanosarcina sp. KYL-1]MCQ1535404.1 sodium-dependent transporter [Methanosarcina sp. KYL-1]
MSERKTGEREQLGSRLGFLLISAGCAIGLGNVWRFPFITGKYGGAAFVLVYLAFLLLLGLPIMVMEFSIGRAGRKNIAGAMRALEPAKSKWHIFGYLGIIGNVILMMFYTTVAGWGFAYFYRELTGAFSGLAPEEIGTAFGAFLGSTGELIFWMAIVVVLGFFVCSLGLQKGVERVGKFMMSGMFIMLLILVFKAVTLPGADAGLSFYLKPDFSNFGWEGIYAAMGQAFFTLSLGLGGMAIFGSYIGKERSLTGESLHVMALDTLVALLAGMVIFPTAFAFGVNVGTGPGLVFVTLPNIFNQMLGGQLWGSLFFMFLTFATMTTVIAVFENIMAFTIDEWGWNRKKAALINGIGIFALSLPCALGFGPWNSFAPLGEGTVVLDLEDFILSNNLLPLGALVFVLFCTNDLGWGWSNFIKEADTGEGIKFPKWIKPYVAYFLPLIILVVFVMGWKDVILKLLA